MIQSRKDTQYTSLFWAVVLGFVFVISLILPRFDVSYLEWWGAIFLLGSLFFMGLFNRRWSLLLILILIFVGGGLRALIPDTKYVTWANWVPSLGVGLFIIMSLVYLISGRLHLWKRLILHPFVIFLSIFILIIIISTVYNRVSLSSLMFSSIIMLRYPIFFILLVSSEYSFGFFNSLFKWFLTLTVLQIPILLAQYIEARSFTSEVIGYGDAMVGTTGSNYIAVFFLIVQSWLFTSWLLRVRKAQLVFPAIIIMSLVTILGEIMIGYIIIPLLLYIFLSSPRARKKIFSAKYLSAILILLVVFSLILMTAAAFFPAIYLGLISLISLNWTIDVNSINFNSIGRIIIIPFSFPSLAADPLRLIWGFGPESTYGGALGGIPGQVVRLMELRGVSWQVIRTTSVFRGMMEAGLVGLFSYWMMTFTIWQWVRNLKWETPDVNLKIAQLVFDAYGLTYVLLWPLYGDAWRLDMLASIFWLGAALVISGWRTRIEAEKQHVPINSKKH